MKKLIFIAIFLITPILLPISVSAADEVYDTTFNSLPETVKDTLQNSEYEIESLIDVIEIISNDGISAILKIVFSDITLPFDKMVTVITVSVIGAVLELFLDKQQLKKTANIVLTAILCLIIISPLKSIVDSVIGCITSGGVFMYSFLPVFASLMVTSSPTTSAVSYTSSTYFFTQLSMFISNSLITPATIFYFVMSITSSIAENMFKDLLASLKKGITWLMSFITTIFTAITSIQSLITSAADSVAIRTGKFIFGTSIPVVGGYVSEVLNTVIGSVSVMRSGVGLFAIIVILILFVPIIIELVAWKISVRLTLVVSTGIEGSDWISVIDAFDSVITILLSVTVCIFIGLILSLSAMLALGGIK